MPGDVTEAPTNPKIEHHQEKPVEQMISLKHVSKYFGEFRALNNVSLEVLAGERVVVWKIHHDPLHQPARGAR